MHAGQEVRGFFTATALRIAASPAREVTWADFLLADVLTSLSKALSDVERAACHLLTGPVMQPHASDQVGGAGPAWAAACGLPHARLAAPWARERDRTAACRNGAWGGKDAGVLKARRLLAWVGRTGREEARRPVTNPRP